MTAALPGVVLAAVSDFVAARLGLHFPEPRWSDLARGIAAAAREQGSAAPAAWAERLVESGAQDGLDALARQLTIGETYFFRESETLDAFEQQILPQLLRARAATRRLRIWSAGCSTGEEPYTIAMLLDRAVPDLSSWNVTILATDVNRDFLRRAARAEYGEWSFRRTPAAMRERYFFRRHSRYALQPSIRERVTFAPLNLAEDVYPSALNGTAQLDVIFCRNVLMYFAADQTRAAAQRFLQALVPDGVLVVGAAETSATLFATFISSHGGGMPIYRKTPAARADALAPHALAPHALAPQAPAPATPAPRPRAPRRPRQAPPRPPAEPVRSAPVDALAAYARMCANAGDFAEAVRVCESAIAADKTNPGHHYLLAVVRQEMGDREGAVRALQQVLYLAPDFVVAHVALARIDLAAGRNAAAARHLANTLAALLRRPPDEEVPESGGLTVARMTEIVRALDARAGRVPA